MPPCLSAPSSPARIHCATLHPFPLPPIPCRERSEQQQLGERMREVKEVGATGGVIGRHRRSIVRSRHLTSQQPAEAAALEVVVCGEAVHSTADHAAHLFRFSSRVDRCGLEWCNRGWRRRRQWPSRWRAAGPGRRRCGRGWERHEGRRRPGRWDRRRGERGETADLIARWRRGLQGERRSRGWRRRAGLGAARPPRPYHTMVGWWWRPG